MRRCWRITPLVLQKHVAGSRIEIKVVSDAVLLGLLLRVSL
jgi:hypothetical protein